MLQIQKTPRNSAVELLRILAMLMIVLSHICVHSGFDSTYSMLSINRLFVQFGYLGNLGVALFVLISGYFQCTAVFRPRSVTRLLAQVWFYSISIFLVSRFLFGCSYTGEMLRQVFFPTIFNEYWFFTAYMILLLLSPFLNILLRSLTRQQFQTMLLLMILLWSVIPTFTKQSMYAAELPQFLLYYCLGAWFRLYPDNIFQKKLLRWSAAVGAFLVLYGLTIVIGYCERFTPEAFGASYRFYDRNSLLILTAAMGIFSVSIACKPFTSRFVNTVAGCTFGVYLIHDNPVIRVLLWKDWLHWGDYFTSGSFIPRLIISVLLVFSVCTLIEWLRQKIVAKPLETLADKILGPLLKKGSFV